MGERSAHALSPGEMRPLRDFKYNISPTSLLPSRPAQAAEVRTSISAGMSASTLLSNFMDGTSNNGGPRSATLTFKDLKVTVHVGEVARTVLDGVSGYAEPARILGIMGPPGSGRSTLLDTLAGRLTKNGVYEGEILLNGRRQQLTYGTAAYVSKHDVLVGTLTVRETVYLSALLRLPDSIAHAEKVVVAEGTIEDMGLRDCASVRVGSTFYRSGLGEGEKRRLSIALELLMGPQLVYLDDPIDGLDSASAFCLMARLKGVARDGRTIIATFLQPSADSFELIDDLCLLGKGKMVYFGDASTAAEHFARSGYACPPGYNVPEHLMRTLDPAYDEVKFSLSYAHTGAQEPDKKEVVFREETPQVVRALASSYTSSPVASKAAMRRRGLAIKKGAVLVSHGRSAKFSQQVAILSYRSIVNCTRDLTYYWSRLGVSIVLMILLGSIFSSLGDSNSSIQARVSCLFVVLESLMLVAVIGGSPFFLQDIKLLLRERLNPHYGVGTFVVGSTVASLPFLLVMSTVSTCVVYFMPGLHTGFEQFGYFVLSIFASLLAVESLMMVVAAMASSSYMVLTFGLCCQMGSMVVAGFFYLKDDLPKPLWRYPLSYMSFHTYALRGLVVNEFEGSTFSNDETPNGDSLVDRMYSGHKTSKWTDLVIVVLIAFVYRAILCGLVVSYERLEPAIVSLRNRHEQKKTCNRHLLERRRRAGDALIPPPRAMITPQHSGSRLLDNSKDSGGSTALDNTTESSV